MLNTLLLTALLQTPLASSSRDPDYASAGSHKYYLEELGQASEATFQRILRGYDRAIGRNDVHWQIRLEKCRFVYGAVTDDEDDGEGERCWRGSLRWISPRDPLNRLKHRIEN